MSYFLLFNFTYEMTVRQMSIKNRTYYFYNDLINIKDFDARLLKLDKKISMGLGIYEWNVNCVNPLYLMINKIDGLIEEKDENKYLNISNTNKNSEVLKKYSGVWNVSKK